MSNTQPLVTVTSKPGTAYLQEIKAGLHKAVSDVSIVVGGTDQGPTPHEYFLGSLAACAAMTMQLVAQRKSWNLAKVTINMYEEQVDDPSQPGQKVTKITEEILIEGNLAPAEVTALEAAAKKCPVYKLFTGPKIVETTLTHVNPQGAQVSGGTAAPATSPTPPAPATPGDATK